MVNVYIEVVSAINNLQMITKCATQKIVIEILCTIIFVYYAVWMIVSYIKLNDSIGIYIQKKELLLKKILEDELPTAFFNDKLIFWEVNDQYLQQHYEPFLRLINKEFIYLKVYNKETAATGIYFFWDLLKNLHIF